MKKKNKKILLGFTLVELLIVIGILTVLLSIALIAINPYEQISKTRDITTKAVAQDFSSAAKYYFTFTKTLPWKKDLSCKDELASGKTLSEIPSCVQELTEGGQLEAKVLAATESKEIYVTECSDAIAVCYNPKSKTFNQSSDAKYTRNGVIQPDCPSTNGTSKDCYACTFSTNEAQECFQALSPNGTLALGPSPAPNELLPIPSRHSKNTCNTPSPGEVGCMADVVTNSAGDPLSSLAPPAGFGPDQIHSAYNLPCTPGGGVQATCTQPTTFGPQVIAVILAYHTPTIESDLAVYSQTYGLPSCTIANGCLTIVNQNGATSPLPGTDSSWSLEASLDVQMAHAVCQTCKILLVEANSNLISDLGIAVNRAAAMGATAISNSYGAAEWSGEATYDTYYNHPGIFMTAASGDWGYGGYYPAASKHVIAVGGTTLSLFSDNKYASESVWNGTGSGCSAYQTAQTFQTALSNWSGTGCGTKRGITDISALADPNTGVAVYDSTSYSGRSGWWILGGTSVSSPIISAALVLAGNAPANTASSSFIYANPSKFRDVINGSNGSCAGGTMCTGGAGYDGPTGLGSPNLLAAQQAPSATPTNTPSPTAIPTPTPTTTPLNCLQMQTVTLNQSNPIIALPGDTVNNTLTITSNDSSGCFAQYTISYGMPTGLTLTGMPASFTLSGGATKYIPFTITVPSNTAAGNYGYQFWVAKQGQSSVNPVNGSIQVAQVGPTNTPTPTPINCFHMWSSSLGSTSMSGNAGDTLQQTITITNNNPASCGDGNFGISYAYPTGFVINGIMPPGFTIPGGQSKTITFTITISSGAQIQDYLTQFWVNNDLPMNGTIHVIGLYTPPPVQMFSNFTPKMYSNYALLEYSYNATGAVGTRLDVATDPTLLNQTSGSNPNARYGFAFNYGSAMDASNKPTPTTVEGFIVSSPQSWSGWQCGATIYYRMYNSGDLRIASPIQSGVVDCTTVINVLPWDPWYKAIYQGVYDSRYDADNNGTVNWTDYWMLVRATRLR